MSPTSSAEPQQLYAYDRRNGYLSDDLHGLAGSLNGALDRFASSCTEGAFRVDVGGLPDSLRSYASQNGELGRWVAQVGARFEEADSGSLFGREPEQYSSVIGTIEKPDGMIAMPDWLEEWFKKHFGPNSGQDEDEPLGESVDYPYPTATEDEQEGWWGKVKDFFGKVWDGLNGQTPEVHAAEPAGEGGSVPLGEVNGLGIGLSASTVGLWPGLARVIENLWAWIRGMGKPRIAEEPGSEPDAVEEPPVYGPPAPTPEQIEAWKKAKNPLYNSFQGLTVLALIKTKIEPGETTGEYCEFRDSTNKNQCVDWVEYCRSDIRISAYAKDLLGDSRTKPCPPGAPTPGSVLIWPANKGGALDAGHVAIVESVNPDGTVNIIEQNVPWGKPVMRRSNVKLIEGMGFIPL